MGSTGRVLADSVKLPSVQEFNTNNYLWVDLGKFERTDFHSSNLPADILPTLLATLPIDRRLSAMMSMFGDTCELSITIRSEGGKGINPLSLLATTAKETGEATQALIHLVACPTEAARKAALIEAREAEAAIQQTVEALECGVL